MNKESLIYLVDDNPLYLWLLKEKLEQLNARDKDCIFRTFSSGEHCLQALISKPDIIVLDYYLNGVNPQAKNGVEILKIVKSLHPEIEVIILSRQEDDASVIHRSLKEKAYSYVFKGGHAEERIYHLIREIQSPGLADKLSA